MKQLTGLYVITDEEISPGKTHAEIAAAALEGGARIIQLRDKTASDRKFYECALEIRRFTRDAGALFFINDRVHIAAAVKADGINIGQNDLPIAAAREILGRALIIGVSADTIEQAMQAEKDGADYVGFGPVFHTSTKLDAGPVSGLDILEQICKKVAIPIVAIGGIGIGNIASVSLTNTACAAVVSAIVCAEDMVSATDDLIREFNSNRESRQVS